MLAFTGFFASFKCLRTDMEFAMQANDKQTVEQPETVAFRKLQGNKKQ